VSPPAHFGEGYAFQTYQEDASAAPRRDEALHERDQVGDLVSRAIAEIFAEYQTSVAAYPDIDALEARLAAAPDAARAPRVIAVEQPHADPSPEGRRDDEGREAARASRVAVLSRSTSRETS
jgi:hypothetical protein